MTFPVSQCFRGIALEADQLLNELESNLSNQEDKLAQFARQQREVGRFRDLRISKNFSRHHISF